MDVIAGNAQEERDLNRHLWSRLYGTRTTKTIEPIPNPKNRHHKEQKHRTKKGHQGSERM